MCIRYKKRVITALVLPAILLAGCGGAASQPETTTTSAVAMTEADDPGVSYAIPKVIDQKVTPFGDNGCPVVVIKEPGPIKTSFPIITGPLSRIVT